MNCAASVSVRVSRDADVAVGRERGDRELVKKKYIPRDVVARARLAPVLDGI